MTMNERQRDYESYYTLLIFFFLFQFLKKKKLKKSGKWISLKENEIKLLEQNQDYKIR